MAAIFLCVRKKRASVYGKHGTVNRNRQTVTGKRETKNLKSVSLLLVALMSIPPSHELTNTELAIANSPLMTDMTEEVFQERLAVAKKLCNYYLHHPGSGMDDQQRQAYEQYPMWGFYVDADGSGLARRVFGIAGFEEDGALRLETVAALILMNNCALNGCAASSIRRVDRWPEEQEAKLRSGMVVKPGMYLDPLGFQQPLFQYSR
jgi:hypothetical protein